MLEISVAILIYILSSFFFFFNKKTTFTAPPVVTVLQDTMAKLPCPQRHTSVSWTRYINGERITLASIKNGEDVIPDKRFALEADNTLVIMKALVSDSGMFMCGSSKIYLNVTTDPKSVGSTLGSDGEDADKGSGDYASPDIWKAAAGVAVGAAVTLLSVVALILCLKRRGQKDQKRTVAEEVKHVEEEPLENPYVSISEAADASTATVCVLYSKVNKQRAGGSSGEEFVYSLAQTSPQTGSPGSGSHYHAVP